MLLNSGSLVLKKSHKHLYGTSKVLLHWSMYKYKYFVKKDLRVSEGCYDCLYFSCQVLPKAALWLRRVALSGASVGASSPEWHMDDK